MIENYDIQIKNLNYGILKDINLYVPYRSKVGIVGKTGAGKTTLLNLLMKIYLPPRGTIFLGNKDILEIPDPEYKVLVGGVLQENFFFSTTIRENLQIPFFDFLDGLDEQKILKALDFSSFDINEFPRKLEEIVGEKGVKLSGGQKERLALARSILKEPKILVLDDSFANVDINTEREIQKNLIESDMTVILASHRVIFMRDYDMIICIEDGKITEIDTPENLLSKDSVFRRFYEAIADWIG
ncbi:MAG: ABC transporter ATP-binding protein/permease [Candidatus Calescibacterium sp.]|nr:ABC transporter ATP-binding protein/permease [Candidatus Calescibacterium sp.]MCX7734855.1 ABC transporter ATP-binding protein/permease [bacterium]MDW8087984.1 ABC transporter ATP-binding protein [Candidatus Calescibacterium sp.]